MKSRIWLALYLISLFGFASFAALAVSVVFAPKELRAEPGTPAGKEASTGNKTPAIATPGKTEKLDFNRDIRPILSDRCFKCHGFDSKNRQAGLRLDQFESYTAKLESGETAVVPGKSAESELVKRILSTDAETKMPPRDSGKHLNAAEIDLLKRWIDEGAEFKGHWAFIPPVRPLVPTPKKADWAKNPIDRFLLTRLEKAGLHPQKEAGRASLIRRVSLDLTGLPPTPAEIDAFLGDNSPEAYEKLVDRLLASPRFGEHMARYWLDSARYADTHGLHFDNERFIWMYRDYVINAFNSNKPFKDFVIEQMAGDMLPNSTNEQRIATGFNRCNVTTNEGGSINDEVLARYAVDRVETMSTVFLGLTAGCASCHDHKFDPLTQKEFYQLYAFFSGSADAAMDGNIKAPPPILRVATKQQEDRQKSIETELSGKQKQIEEYLAKIQYTDPGKDNQPVASEPKEFVWIEDSAPDGAQLSGHTPWKFVSKKEFPVYSGEKASTRTSNDGVSQHFFTGASKPLDLGDGDKFFCYVYLDPKNPPKTIMLQFNDGTWEHRAYWGEDLIPYGTGETAHRSMGSLPKSGEWVRLEVEASKVGLGAGSKINGWAFTQFNGTVYWDKAGVVTRLPQSGKKFESLAAWEEFERSQQKSKTPGDVTAALKIEPAKRTDDQKKKIRDYFLKKVYAKTKADFDKFDGEIAAINQKKKELDNQIPQCMVMAEMPKPRDTYVLIRGQYDKRGEKVTAAVPSFLGKLPKDAPANRLGLAQWLVDPANPLPARVTVNRFWQQYFGTGLVRTSEDFGSQGSWPTHPELLDWLSVEFVESGWNVKALQKLIVMSSAYRQDSKVTPQALQADPDNLLLARGPRFRMDAEMIRDQALYFGGLLVEKQGGRGVRPYQPDGIWESISFSGSDTQNFKADKGEGLYRRSIYTFWKRTAPPPSLMTFDAPSREACVVRRGRTNTPLQALVLMNDTQYVEAARLFALHVVKHGGDGPESRLSLAFRMATGRVPKPDELDVLMKMFNAQLEAFKANPGEAKKLIAVGEAKSEAALPPEELAAYLMSASLILNLDETVTKE